MERTPRLILGRERSPILVRERSPILVRKRSPRLILDRGRRPRLNIRHGKEVLY